MSEILDLGIGLLYMGIALGGLAASIRELVQ